ncbi:MULTISPECIES: N-6 DNA methylase [Vagococcus]|uniref:site-specific DNA-methyltransferase (adenine-specific) n=1 Tax=Vagococcus fluvialis bH819 TaxID=1255619 RepID=A0A1X6WMM1_9ENTE|nr:MULTISPECIES: N-6 DNA methylase [Vagococcus]SLM85472.1 putative type II restriction enzyme methylase subunit [Vagococcus fluvialis bH819]HCM89233.1 restriction endonuclease [Vagococcus sp.]
MNKQLQSYYTKNSVITDYMINMLDIHSGEHIFEPCVGDGVFIDAILKKESNILISAMDINSNEVHKLKKIYKDFENIKISDGDTLFDTELDTLAKNNKYFDKIIGNPPYGAWQDMSKRALLKDKYGTDTYVKETYTLFIKRCMSLLKNGGKLSFIIPDTFLYLHNHESIRKMLLTDTKIKEILLFPSKLFPGVSFGYSKLSIITLVKNNNLSENRNNVIKIYSDLKYNKDIVDVTNRTTTKQFIELKQEDILRNKASAFYLANTEITNHFNDAEVTLGDIANVVTGIYTGDNKKYICKANDTVKRAKDYAIVPNNLINLTEQNTTGISAKQFYIPLVKGSSSTKYFRNEDDWFINWSTESVNYYKSGKKARFQNSDFYFKEGIVIPMIKSSKINATYINKRVFDQSLVGIFPKDSALIEYILAFLNSDIAVELLKIINPTANSSANYVKKLPIIIPSDETKVQVENYVHKIKESKNKEEILLYHNKLNEIFNFLYKKK